jgi:hypothetical protein
MNQYDPYHRHRHGCSDHAGPFYLTWSQASMYVTFTLSYMNTHGYICPSGSSSAQWVSPPANCFLARFGWQPIVSSTDGARLQFKLSLLLGKNW